MKIHSLLALATLTALSVGAGAQTPTHPTQTPPVKTKPPVKKTTPIRDPKTGRFMKKATPPATKMHTKGALKKTMPMRDPKTGRFLKKKG